MEDHGTVVLVVDDDPPIRALIEKVLQRDGHTVVSARHGAEAMGLLAEQKFSLMLLDVMMPVANAADVLAFMREQPAWTPTILVTAVHDTQLATLNIDGVLSVVRKPFDIQALQTLVRTALQA